MITLKKIRERKRQYWECVDSLLCRKSLSLIDNFEIALSQDNVNEEIKTLGNMLSTVLNSLQIEEIGAHGEDFDPNIHEAVEHSGNGDSQKVESVLRKGYLFKAT